MQHLDGFGARAEKRAKYHRLQHPGTGVPQLLTTRPSTREPCVARAAEVPRSHGTRPIVGRDPPAPTHSATARRSVVEPQLRAGGYVGDVFDVEHPRDWDVGAAVRDDGDRDGDCDEFVHCVGLGDAGV